MSKRQEKIDKDLKKAQSLKKQCENIEQSCHQTRHKNQVQCQKLFHEAREKLQEDISKKLRENEVVLTLQLNDVFQKLEKNKKNLLQDMENQSVFLASQVLSQALDRQISLTPSDKG